MAALSCIRSILAALGAPDPVAAGNDLIYTVTVGNRGVNPASSVKLVDTLPPEASGKHRYVVSRVTAAEVTGVAEHA